MTATDVTMPRTVAEYRPGTLHLRDAWLAMAHAAALKPNRSIRRTVHGEPVFFWREAGTLHAGSRPDAAACARDGVTALTRPDGQYHVAERHGMLWAWYGDPRSADPDLLPHIPSMTKDGRTPAFQHELRYDCTYELMCENTLDSTHADFVHSSFLGGGSGDRDEIYVDSTSETVTMTRVVIGHQVPRFQRHFADGASHQDQFFVVHAHARNGLTVAHAWAEPGFSLVATVAHTPISPTATAAIMTVDTELTGWARKLMMAALPAIARQDNWAIRAQNRNYLNADPKKDLSSRFDSASLRFRKVFTDLAARQLTGDYTYGADADPSRDVTDLIYADTTELRARGARRTS